MTRCTHWVCTCYEMLRPNPSKRWVKESDGMGGVICCRLTLTLFLSFLSSVRTWTEQTTHRYRHFYRHLREISRRPIIGTFRWARSYHKNTKIITPKTIWICSFTRSREVATYLCPLPCVLSGTERHASAVRTSADKLPFKYVQSPILCGEPGKKPKTFLCRYVLAFVCNTYVLIPQF